MQLFTLITNNCFLDKQFIKTVAPKPPVPPQAPPVQPPSSDKDTEDYKEEFEDGYL